jgi:hypothetical protein
MEIYRWRSELLMIRAKLLAMLSLVKLKVSENSSCSVETLCKGTVVGLTITRDSEKL